MNRFLKRTLTVILVTVAVFCCASPAFAVDIPPGPGIQFFDGDELIMSASIGGGQMNSFVLTTKNGQVIVVDGGTNQDAAYLRQLILQKGGHVSAWFITHPHEDHAGALAQIITEGLGGITIDGLYASYLPLDWYLLDDPARGQFAINTVSAFSTLGKAAHLDIKKGDKFVFDDVVVNILNDPFVVDSNSINNSSIMIRMDVGKTRVLFTGDLGPQTDYLVLDSIPAAELKADIVQMSHHGQRGLGLAVYKVIAPKACLWPAPPFLYYDTTGKYETMSMRAGMKELGVNLNYTIAEGTQIIR